MPLPGLQSGITNVANRGRALPDSRSEQPGPLPLTRPIVSLYLLTLFLNAALLFIIEPMVAKMILPFAGGSPVVWTTSMLFFQMSLLVGYLYAHFASSWLGASRHALVHLIIILAGLLFLPIAISVNWFSTQRADPSITVFAVLVSSIGFPFFALSAGAPLLQKWFAQANHPTARDPYFMYAASNLGSMAGLVAYPIFFERHLTLTQQADYWLWGYLVLLLGTAGCIFLSLRPVTAATSSNFTNTARRAAPSALTVVNGAITMPRRMRWLCWSFVPSSLLLGVTNYVTTDIVSAPLFWVLPLAIYLLTYVLAFARGRWVTHSFVVRRQAFVLLAAALTVFVRATTPVGIILPLHLMAFFATALLCHGQLAQDRPEPSRLTEYYLWISIGGALGGLFNTIVAPLLFSSVLEYPLAMMAAAFLRPYVGVACQTPGSRRLDWILPAALFLVILLLVGNSQLSDLNAQLLIFAIAGVVCLGFAYRPIRFGLGLGAILLGALIAPHPIGKTLYAARSFFGVYRVIDDVENKRHLLLHGTTVHGAQNLIAEGSRQPIGYYHRSGPAGQVLRLLAHSRPQGKIAIVGLGTGALACHGSPQQQVTFFEIDPLVEEIARNSTHFTYLRDCSPKSEVIIGDARISLAKVPDRQYDIIVLDAFSSDMIPAHLVTLEAMELYLAKSAENGIVLFHVSNRYLDLAPILDRLSHRLTLAAFIQNDFRLTAEEQKEGKSASRWIVMAHQRKTLEPLLSDSRWRSLDGRLGGDLWTDDFTDVLKIMYWR